MLFAWGKEAQSPLFTPTWTRSVQLYRQPHAIWLTGDSAVGVNLGPLQQVLTLAANEKQVPELVIYTIPLRDLGQSSEGGFKTYDDYLADNRLIAREVSGFVQRTGLAPRVYLEPDALPLALDFRKTHTNKEEANRVYHDRVSAISQLIQIYKQAGAKVFMDAAHSGWFDYDDAQIDAIAGVLNEAGIAQADGLVSNVSNRQKLRDGDRQSEFHYLGRLLPRLKNKNLEVVVDTSRNGGETHPRMYYLAPGGQLIDNETPGGRLVGSWRRDESQSEIGEIYFNPFFGPQKSLTQLLGKEKYKFVSAQNILVAPPWLDPVGDVKLGPSPTDDPPSFVKPLIHRLRYIKPPDDCDGSLNCPPGQSKHDIIEQTQRMQPVSLPTDKAFWARLQQEVSY
jgi:hypothetical protein